MNSAARHARLPMLRKVGAHANAFSRTSRTQAHAAPAAPHNISLIQQEQESAIYSQVNNELLIP